MVVELGYKEVLLQTDCLMVYSAWTSPHGNHSYLASIIAGCLLLYRSFVSFQLLHVGRTNKMAANFMENYALSYP